MEISCPPGLCSINKVEHCPCIPDEILPVRLGVQLNLAERIERGRAQYKKEHGLDPCVDILPPGVSYIDGNMYK